MRSRPALLTAAAAAIALPILLAPSRADAFERQWHAGAAVGFALLADPNTYVGFGARLHGAYGITDAFNLMLELDLAAHPGGDVTALGASAGAAYIIDILEWVPYIGLELGAYDIMTSGVCGGAGELSCHNGKFGIGVPFGIDYIFTRSFAAGFAGKYTLLLPGVEDLPGSYFTAYARAEFIWGY